MAKASILLLLLLVSILFMSMVSLMTLAAERENHSSSNSLGGILWSTDMAEGDLLAMADSSPVEEHTDEFSGGFSSLDGMLQWAIGMMGTRAFKWLLFRVLSFSLYFLYLLSLMCGCEKFSSVSLWGIIALWCWWIRSLWSCKVEGKSKWCSEIICRWTKKTSIGIKGDNLVPFVEFFTGLLCYCLLIIEGWRKLQPEHFGQNYLT